MGAATMSMDVCPRAATETESAGEAGATKASALRTMKPTGQSRSVTPDGLRCMMDGARCAGLTRRRRRRRCKGCARASWQRKEKVEVCKSSPPARKWKLKGNLSETEITESLMNSGQSFAIRGKTARFSLHPSPRPARCTNRTPAATRPAVVEGSGRRRRRGSI